MNQSSMTLGVKVYVDTKYYPLILFDLKTNIYSLNTIMYHILL